MGIQHPDQPASSGLTLFAIKPNMKPEIIFCHTNNAFNTDLKCQLNLLNFPTINSTGKMCLHSSSVGPDFFLLVDLWEKFSDLGSRDEKKALKMTS